MSADTIARLKISLDDAKPAVLRRVEVPFDIRLDRLHLTIQAAMGWTNSHLYEIRAGNVGWSTPDPDADWASDFIDARKARLGDILEDIGTRRWRTSMTSATVGSIRSRSSISPIPSQACSTRA
ncbi:MAG TPA: plasmid pRiA4b ORF-3 family protein [Stellaceae bacterium]|nr:plasmid pRiA4b ORF-3 family protein [Stellaceae bacterium]